MDKIFRKRGGRSYKFNNIIPKDWFLVLESGEEFKTMEDYGEFLRKKDNRKKAAERKAKARKENKETKEQE